MVPLRGQRAAAMPTRSIHSQTSQPTLQMMRSSFKLFLISLVLTCHWCPAAIIVAADETKLDEKSLAMAKRIVQKVKESENPPPSWNMIAQVLENSFLGVPDNNSNFYETSPHEEKGRERALQWLAHEDASATNLSDGEYDRGLLERYALSTIYFATNGDGWNRCSRPKQKSPKGKPTDTDSICGSDEERFLSPYSHLKWSGINGKDGKVTWLDLSDQGIVSSTFLPLEFTLLSPSLELLWVSENEQLEGILPNYLGEFQSLVSLSVYKTSVSGSIPESIYTLPKLNSVRFYKSKFEGTISTQIENMAELKWFWIHNNAFTGVLPKEIGELSKLEGVTLHGNKFTPIEEENGNLKSNIIPEALCSLKTSSLKHLWTDCEDGALAHGFNDEEGGKKAELMVKEGVQACSCCTRCFPRN